MAKRKEREDEKAIEKALERHVPSDIVEEILYKLPCKSVGRLMSTCKLWHSVATDRHFISSHQRRTVSSPSHFLLPDEDRKRVHLYSLDVNSFNHVGSIVPPLDCPYDAILPSSHGLACVYNVEKKMVVFNPITQQIVNLAGMPPSYHPQYHLIGFGFHPRIKKYKADVLSLARIRGDIIISGHMLKLHPSGRSIWRPISHSTSDTHDYACCQRIAVFTRRRAVCADEVFYWGPHVLEHNFDILSFDLQTKKFQWVTAPKRSWNLINLQEKLCSVEVLDYGSRTKWMMPIWMLTDSIWVEWTPFHTLNFGPEVRSMFPLCTQHGKVILTRGHMIYSYDIEEKSLKVLKGEHPACGYRNICAHAETLV